MTRQIRQTLAAGMLASALVAGFSTRADAAFISITPTADGRGLDSFLDENFTCCMDGGFLVATRNMSFEERIAIEFALGALPSDATITSATLTLHATGAPLPVIPNFADVHGYAGDGAITAADMTVSNLLTTFAVNGAGQVDISLDPGFIQGLLTADEDFAGFMVRQATVPSGVLSFWSSDSGFEEFFPTLALEYDVVPEPSTLLLFGTALTLLARRVRRYRRVVGTVEDVSPQQNV